MDFKVTFLFIFILLINAELKSIDHDATLYIYNGDDAREGEFPWMAMIANYQGGLHCGGSLISPRHVITAGHCTFGMPIEKPPMIIVLLAVHNVENMAHDNNIVATRVTRIIRHPSYKSIYQFDFAILELENYISFSNLIQPICLSPPNLNLEGENGVVTGWGFVKSNTLSKTLQKATIPVWNWEKCKRLYEEADNYELSDAMLCAGDIENRKDSCAFDSGGPLVWQEQPSKRWFLIGIVSWGAECGGDLPGVYSNVSSVYNWIVSQTNYTC